MDIYKGTLFVDVLLLLWTKSTLGEPLSREIGPLDYCNMETFNATCRRDEIIIINDAQYGRMNIGRCVKGNYGYLGCSSDVISIMDIKCSGRHSCDFTVPDPNMYEKRKCPGDFTSYLRVSYSCVPVAYGSRKQCQASRRFQLTSSSGYISSLITKEMGLGSVHCPLVIRVDDGQTINLTLLNFIKALEADTENNVKLNARRGDMCYELAVIKEKDERDPSHEKRRPITVCAQDERRRLIYTSSTNEVTVEITNRRLTDAVGVFVIKYEAVGCSHLKQIHNAWVHKGEDGTMKIKCNHSDETWFLTCKGNTWLGDIGNCTHPSTWSLVDLFGAGHQFPYGILIVVGIGVVLGIIVGAVLLSCVVMYTRRKQPPFPHSVETLENKPIVTGQNQPNGEYRGQPTYPPPPPPSQNTGGDYPVLESSPRPDPIPPPPPDISSLNATVRENFIRNISQLDSETQYGSSGVTTFSTFGRRQHIYECPNFT